MCLIGQARAAIWWLVSDTAPRTVTSKTVYGGMGVGYLILELPSSG